MADFEYVIGYTPSCNKDAMSINIIQTCKNKKDAKLFLVECFETSLSNLKLCKIKVCKYCIENDDEMWDDFKEKNHEKTCLNLVQSTIDFEHDIYHYNLEKYTEKQLLDNMGIENYHDCNIYKHLFWLIKVEKGTKRKKIKRELNNYII